LDSDATNQQLNLQPKHLVADANAVGGPVADAFASATRCFGFRSHPQTNFLATMANVVDLVSGQSLFVADARQTVRLSELLSEAD